MEFAVRFHPGTFVAKAAAHSRKTPKYSYDSVRVQKGWRRRIYPLPPKSNFEIDNPHLLYQAARCSPFYKFWLQSIGQSITQRYIYFDTLRADKRNRTRETLMKRPEMQPFAQRLLACAKMEQNVRFQMRRIVYLWHQKRYRHRLLNTEDPGTMSEPEHPIILYDSRARGHYVFEASTLKRQLEENLAYCKWLVPEPMKPKNPLTNLPFHPGQLSEILRQLTCMGKSSWILEGYKEHKHDLTDFLETFRQPLQIRAVENCRKNPTSEDTLDFVGEFIEDEFDYHDIPLTSTLTILKWALEHKADTKYMQSWIQAWAEYYKATILHGEETIRKNPHLVSFAHDMSADLFRNKVMITKLGRMRLEMLGHPIVQSPPPPQSSPLQVQVPLSPLPAYEEEVSPSDVRNVRARSEGVVFDLGDGVNLLFALPDSVHVTIPSALIEELLNHEPPSD